MIQIDNILDVEKYINDIDAVIFDLDDTLYSEKEYVRSGYRCIARWLGKTEVEEQLWNSFQRGGKAIDEVLEGKDHSEALHIYRNQQPAIHLYSGVGEMIERIRKQMKVGIITDGRPEGQRAKIKALGLQVDKVIVTDELGGVEYRKPNPLAFVKMQKAFDIPFKKMIYVGDNLSKDFIAPEKLKMKYIYLRNEEGLYYQQKV
ncbi:MAG: HAD family hydrolase [Hespellia sp.]|nr:HAD family hydrolase [Hespellia sp.]